MTHENWKGFNGGEWQDTVNVRDFIQKNYGHEVTGEEVAYLAVHIRRMRAV